MYPSPKQVGGALIRRVMKLARENNLELPLSSPVFIAVSGGADSVALAHLISTYGRRFVEKSRLTIIHINHHWRGAASNRDAAFVARFARKLDVPFRQYDLDPAHLQRKESPEEAARVERLKIFQKLIHEFPGAKILSAHHADDVVETWVWRLFTGQIQTHGEAIHYEYEHVIRPFLTTHKNELFQYLKEEKLKFRFDRSNRDERYLRARMRKRLIPALDALFPRWKEHVLKEVETSKSARRTPFLEGASGLQALSVLAGLKLRRAHFDEWMRRLKNEGEEQAMPLPRGYRFRVEKDASGERYILEKTSTKEVKNSQ